MANAATRPFPLGDVLTVATGVMVTPGGMPAVRELVSHMCGGPVYTNQMGDALSVCGPALLAQHPQLRDVTPPELTAERGSAGRAEEIAAWLARQVETHGGHLDVTPLPDGAFRRWEFAEAAEDMADRFGASNTYAADLTRPGAADEIAGLVRGRRRG